MIFLEFSGYLTNFYSFFNLNLLRVFKIYKIRKYDF